MKKLLALIILPVVLGGPWACAARTDLRPLADLAGGGPPAFCQKNAPDQPWAASFKIDGVFLGGRRVVLIGANRYDPVPRRLESVLLTVEGLVVFAGTVEPGRIFVEKALPPFDGPDLARGLLADVELMFLTPTGPPDYFGINPDGRPACRWRKPDGSVIEIGLSPNGDKTILLFDPWGRLTRRVLASAVEENGPPGRLRLQALRGGVYNLTVELLEKER
ncbi:MAG: hypothetical protein V1816_22905 [Pseudomonadota bacterium]